MHPAGAVVESLVDEELTPRYRAVVVEALLTRNLHLGAEEKRGVRIDEKERVVGERVRWRDGDAVRPAIRFAFTSWRNCFAHRLRNGSCARNWGRTAVKRTKLGQVHRLDVGSNTSVAERERHPRLQ